MLNAGGKKYRIYFLEILLDEDPYMLCSLSHSRIWKKVLISFLVGPKLVFLSFSSGHVDGSAGIPTKRYDAASQWQWCHSEASTGSSTLDQILVSRLELSRWIYFHQKSVGNCVAIFPSGNVNHRCWCSVATGASWLRTPFVLDPSFAPKYFQLDRGAELRLWS